MTGSDDLTAVPADAHGNTDIECATKLAGLADPSPSITVLLVDDSNTIRRSASSFLSAAGYTVITAIDGFDALAKVVEYRPDIVFVDIVMPRLDGYQTCALIKNNADYRAIPVVMLSGKDGLFDKARGRLVGSDSHLSKPFTAQTLTATVVAHTNGQSPDKSTPVIAKSPELESVE